METLSSKGIRFRIKSILLLIVMLLVLSCIQLSSATYVTSEVIQKKTTHQLSIDGDKGGWGGGSKN